MTSSFPRTQHRFSKYLNYNIYVALSLLCISKRRWLMMQTLRKAGKPLHTHTQSLLTSSVAASVWRVPPTPMLLMKQGATARTRGSALSQHKRLWQQTALFVFTWLLLEMTDVPISPCLGIRGMGGGAGSPCTEITPLGLQRKVTDQYCVSFRLCQRLFH